LIGELKRAKDIPKTDMLIAADLIACDTQARYLAEKEEPVL
jgi:hypothetical protein